MNYFVERINELSFDKAKEWNNENKEEFAILLSAPSCFIHNWNLNYMEIDNVDMKEIDDILQSLNIEDKNGIYEYYEYWFDNTAGADYEQFKSFWDGHPCFELEELTSDGQEAFTACEKFAVYFKDIIGAGGFYGWDFSEIVQVIRMGFMKGWLNYEEAGLLLEQVADGAYQKFNSWKEFAISFICGGTYSAYKDCGFLNEEFDEKSAYESFDTLCNVVQELFSDTYGEYWNLPL